MSSEFKDLTWKEQVRLSTFPKFATLLNKCGLSWKTLGQSKLGNTTLIAQAQALSRTLDLEKPGKTPLDILIVTMLGGHPHNLTCEILLAWALRQKGHRVRFVLDDGTLPITEDHKIGLEHRYNEISAKSYFFGYKYISAAGFEVLKLSDLCSQEQIDDVSIEKYQHIIEAALLKHYKRGLLDDSLTDLPEKRRMFERSAKINALVGQELSKMQPDRVIMSHGIYTTWGLIFDKLRGANIPIVTYGRGKKIDTQRFNWNITSDWWDVDEEWGRVKDQPLTNDQAAKVDKYLESRVTHSEDVLVYNFGKLEEREKTIERFDLDPSKTTFSLFTNVLWDAASANREIAFPNPVKWVFETIRWFAANPEKQLIVKIHPAEKVIGTNQPFMDLINSEFEEIPENIRIILPDEEVNSWSIMKITDLGLVHTTTVGMELPLVGVPCVVVSSTYFREKGFTIDINNKEEYFQLLETFNPREKALDESTVELAKRYAYLLFERYQIPIPFLREVTPLDTRSIDLNEVSDLLKHDTFSRVVHCIINRESVILKG